MTQQDDIKATAKSILDELAFTPFEDCQPLSRAFETIPMRPGLYALRHRVDGLLYVGKAKSLRDRLRGGHKAFLWGWLDRYDQDDVGVVVSPIQYWVRSGKSGLMLELETLILQSTQPPYNARIPREI